MNLTALLILIIYAVAFAFFIYAEIRLKKHGSHLEIAEIVPLNIKNITDMLKEIGVSNIRNDGDSEYYFVHEEKPWALIIDQQYAIAYLGFYGILDEECDFEKARSAASSINAMSPGTSVHIGDDRKMFVSTVVFTDNTYLLKKAFPYMVRFVNETMSDFSDLYKR